MSIALLSGGQSIVAPLPYMSRHEPTVGLSFQQWYCGDTQCVALGVQHKACPNAGSPKQATSIQVTAMMAAKRKGRIQP